MSIIYKYALRLEHQQSVDTVPGKILTVQDQLGTLMMWVMTSENLRQSRQVRQIKIVGTGVIADTAGWNYLTTVQQDPMVWHIFEKDETA